MKKCDYTGLRIFTSLLLSLTTSAALFAQAPEIKVDLNQTGRPLAEVSEVGYTSWFIKSGQADSMTIDGIKFKFTRMGTAGTELASNWYKAGLQAPYYARLANDGLTVKDGNAGGQIEMRISGLPAGPHTLLTYHNTVDNPLTNTFSPIDILLNGIQVIDNLMPSNRALVNSDVPTAYLQIRAVENQDVVLLFSAETTTAATSKNVFINGFELNTANNVNQARLPFPSHAEEHADADAGNILLTWEKAGNAVSHDVYFGKNAQEVSAATTSSPLFKGNQVQTNYAVNSLYSMDTYYWRIDEVNGAGVKTKGNVWYFRPRQLAFKSAEGYGRYARGGRGGKVVEVTNLNDDGPGSLREAVTNNIGPRTIVFTVSGIIQLQSRLVVSQPYVTIAGQTAPGKGITIRKAPFGIGANEVVIRHMRLRLGAGPTFDGMGMVSDHSVIDHCSISWTIDEAFSSRGAKNITLQRTLISEALNVAGHQNYPANTAHGYAATISGNKGSYHHNLLAHNYGRNWSLGGGLDGNNNYASQIDITNNVVYNWGTRATDGGAHEVNFVNNYYKPGPGTTFFYALSADHEGIGIGTQRYYFNGNVMPGRFDETNQAAGRRSTGTVNYETFVNAPFFPSYVNTQSASEAYKNVLSDVGCTQPVFDDHDIRMVHETLSGTYSYKGSVSGKPGFPDNEQDVGGYEIYPEESRAADFDSDHDGLPNWWELAHGLNPNSPADDFSNTNADNDKDGYTNLDDYLEWMSAPHFTTSHDQPVNINLRNLSRGYSLQPAFTLSAVQNGQASLVNDSIARFTPSGNGMASFNFTVTDAQGSTMTRTIGLYINQAVSAALPVILVSFEAARKNANEVTVKWKTAQEINNDHFEVLRSISADGTDASSVAKVKSKARDGNSNVALEYEITDANYYDKKSYYRLLQKDRDGKTKSSEILMVNAGNTSPVLKVWPVPANGRLFVSMANNDANANIYIYDATGKRLLSKIINNNSTEQLYITFPGLYILKVVSAKNGGVLFTEKITVQH